MLPNIPTKQLSLVLRQSLPSDVVNHTLGECDEMLKILEKKYGDSGKIVNVIVNKIKNAKKIGSNDPLALISFVNIIEVAEIFKN